MKNATIPKPILIYAILLAIFGLAMGIWVGLAPDSFLNVGNLTLEGNGKEITLFLFSARNFAFGILFAIGLLFFRKRDVFLTIFGARLAVDIGDTLAMLTATDYHVSAVEIATQLFLFLIPIVVSLYFLWKMEA